VKEFGGVTSRHSFGAALSLCQALVRIVLLTAGLALLPRSLPLSPLSVLRLAFFLLFFIFFFSLFVCKALSASLDGLCYGESGRRRGSLVMGPTFGVSIHCAWTHTHTHRNTRTHTHTHTRTRAHKHTPVAINTREEGQGLRREREGVRKRRQHGTLFQGNLTAPLSPSL